MHLSRLRPVLAIRLFADDTKAFGPGVATLLHHVDALHSLRAAAAAMGMAYSKAWRITKESEALLGFALLDSVTGGKNGGGARLTPEARAFLARYDAYTAALRAASDALFRAHFGIWHKGAARRPLFFLFNLQRHDLRGLR